MISSLFMHDYIVFSSFFFPRSSTLYLPFFPLSIHFVIHLSFSLISFRTHLMIQCPCFSIFLNYNECLNFVLKAEDEIEIWKQLLNCLL